MEQLELFSLVEFALPDTELEIAVQDALTKAIRSAHPNIRQAYIELAGFFTDRPTPRHDGPSRQQAIRDR